MVIYGFSLCGSGALAQTHAIPLVNLEPKLAANGQMERCDIDQSAIPPTAFRNQGEWT